MSVLPQKREKCTEMSRGHNHVTHCGHSQGCGPQECMAFQPMTDAGKKENLRATVVGFHLILGDVFLNYNNGRDSLMYQNTSSKIEYIPCKIHLDFTTETWNTL